MSHSVHIKQLSGVHNEVVVVDLLQGKIFKSWFNMQFQLPYISIGICLTTWSTNRQTSLCSSWETRCQKMYHQSVGGIYIAYLTGVKVEEV